MENTDVAVTQSDAQPDPGEHPTIRINGKLVEVRFKLNAIARLKKEYNIDVRLNAKPEEFVAPSLNQSLAMLSLGISHSVQMTPEELGEYFDYGDIALIGEVLDKALKKVSSPEAAAAQSRAEKNRKLLQSKVNGAVQ